MQPTIRQLKAYYASRLFRMYNTYIQLTNAHRNGRNKTRELRFFLTTLEMFIYNLERDIQTKTVFRTLSELIPRDIQWKYEFLLRWFLHHTQQT